MVRLENVNKYYYKGRSNQIHVIDNTSLELPAKGIFCLLGPSGCGKTTLLNAIGGLDKVDSGNIYIDGHVITRSTPGRIDSIRNAKIGYIFQNFNLLDDRTVFENVEIALRMTGVTDDETVRARVLYCLEKVGICQYRNKKANALSGGQRQRVAIARAIVKNPSIIIADEPTGNLDSANTLEIMNIIKAISEEKLVILVTHEERIARFYSDHIAEMRDGRILRVRENDSSRYLDYQLENKIYLRDMPVIHEFTDSGLSVGVFSDSERDCEIRIVIRDGNIYIDTGGELNIVDENANIELIDDHYTAMDESYFDGKGFDYSAHLPEGHKIRYTPVYNFRSMISSGYRTVKGYHIVRKVLMLGFVFAAMFAFFAVSNLAGVADVKPEDYRTTNGNCLTISNASGSDELIDLVGSLDSVGYVLPGDTLRSVTLPLDDYIQTFSASEDINISLALTSVLQQDQVILGHIPKGLHQVALDKVVIDRFLREKKGRLVGLNTTEAFIGRMITVPHVGSFTITGITDTRSPSLFVHESQALYILTNANDQVSDLTISIDDNDDMKDLIRSGKIRDIALAPESIKVTEGEEPTAINEALVSDINKDHYKIGSKLDTRLNGKKLTVCGYYKERGDLEDIYYVTEETIRKEFVSSQKDLTVYAPNITQVGSLFESQSMAYTVNDERDRRIYIREHKNQLMSALMVAGIVLLVSLIEMYLMLRSSFMSRIKEVGTLRAIGLKKQDIVRMFTGEILVMSSITAAAGIAIMYLLLTYVVKITYFLEDMYMVNPVIALITFALVLGFDLLAGLIPVRHTMRKTPAQILARTDI